MQLVRPLLIVATLFAVIFTIASYGFMYAWVAPISVPTNNNAEAPVDTGTVTQTKDGNLAVNTLAAVTEVRSNRYCDALGNNCGSGHDTSSVIVDAGTADVSMNINYGYETTITFNKPFTSTPAVYLTPITTGDDLGYLSGYGSIYFTPPAGTVGHYCKPTFVSGPSTTGFKLQYAYMMASFSFSDICNIPLKVDWIAVGD